MKQILKNDLLTVEISTHGAELQSILNNRTCHQYLYQGDTAYWGRRSPILFPIVGSVWDGKYLMDGKEYAISQHGFARDSEFTIIEDTPDDEAWFRLDANDDTHLRYPRRFRLEIGYKLTGERISVMWRVTNLDSRDMAFQIGAHPAFYYPGFNPADPIHAYLAFDRKPTSTQLIKEKGCIGTDEMTVSLDEEEMLPVTAETFDINTIILAGNQVRRVSILSKEHTPYLSLMFTAPVVGIWSPSPEAPFICIEPWYGRADRVGFNHEFSEREYANILPPQKTFEASYIVIIENV